MLKPRCLYCDTELAILKQANKYCSRLCSMRAVNYTAGRNVDVLPRRLTIRRCMLITSAVTAAVTTIILLVLHHIF